MIRETILIALTSSFLRAFLNVIDRRLFGHLEGSILTLNFLNSVLPLILLVIGCLSSGLGQDLLYSILNVRILFFALLVQVVAYAFSVAFKHSTIHKVIVLSKSPDIFIPIGAFLFTREWDWSNYIFAVLTTLACIPILFRRHQPEDTPPKYVVLFIISSLILQGSLSPVLVDRGNQIVTNSILFTTGVIFWRTSWSAIGLLHRGFIFSLTKELEISWLVLLRSLVTIGTQVTFILALAQESAMVAWPILNSTALFAIFFSSILLKEKASRLELVVIFTIVALTLIRFYIT